MNRSENTVATSRMRRRFPRPPVKVPSSALHFELRK
jgi:hypothetical protein